MGEVKKALMSATMDDMSIGDEQRLYELSKYTTEELEAELNSRGWNVVSK